MTNEELKIKLKQLIFDESRDEQEFPEDGLRIGLLDNTELFNEVESLLNYYKNREMSDSVKKYGEIMEQKQMFPEITKKADEVFVRLGFSDVVITKEDNAKFSGSVDLISEFQSDDCPIVASTKSYLIGYEDSNGKECHSDGTYLDEKDPNQIELFDDKVSNN